MIERVVGLGQRLDRQQTSRATGKKYRQYGSSNSRGGQNSKCFIDNQTNQMLALLAFFVFAFDGNRAVAGEVIAHMPGPRSRSGARAWPALSERPAKRSTGGARRKVNDLKVTLRERGQRTAHRRYQQ